MTFDSRLDSRFSIVDSRLSTLDSRLLPLDSPLSTLHSRLPILDSRLSTLDSRLPTLDSRPSTLDSRLSNWLLDDSYDDDDVVDIDNDVVVFVPFWYKITEGGYDLSAPGGLLSFSC